MIAELKEFGKFIEGQIVRIANLENMAGISPSYLIAHVKELEKKISELQNRIYVLEANQK